MTEFDAYLDWISANWDLFKNEERLPITIPENALKL